mgnify:FL=1
MTIWGLSKKQRRIIFLIIAILWIGSVSWNYVTQFEIKPIIALILSSLLIVLYSTYLNIDNIRTDKIVSTVFSNKVLFDNISERFNHEFNDVLCRSHIADLLRCQLEAVSSKEYGYQVTDVTTVSQADNLQSIFNIYTNNNYIATYTILPNKVTKLE